LANHGPMHWRGDRTGGADEVSAQPDQGSFDEHAAFMKFNGAFQSLLGRDTQISDEDMDAFADFILEMTYPPNPIRALDNSLTPPGPRSSKQPGTSSPRTQPPPPGLARPASNATPSTPRATRAWSSGPASSARAVSARTSSPPSSRRSPTFAISTRRSAASVS